MGNETEIKNCEDCIATENKVRDALLSSKQPIDPSLAKIDITTLKASIDRIVDDGKKKNIEIEQIGKDIAEIGDIDYSEEDFKKMQRENETLIEKMAIARSTIKHLQDTNKSLQNSEYCPVCHKKFDDVDNSGTIEENKKKIAELIESGVAMKTRSDELSKMMDDITEKRTLYQKKSQLELKLAGLKSAIVSQRLEYTEKKNLLNEIIKNEDAIKKNNEIDTKVNVSNENIKAQERIKRAKEDEITVWGRNVTKNTESASLKKSYIVKIDDEIKTEKAWKLYLQMIGKDGISKMVLRNTLPIINAELNNMLSDVADFNVEIVMDQKDDIDFLLIRDGVTIRLSAASGLEKTQAALALRVVLGKMSRLSRPPFILLDEVLGTVAKENYEDMKKLYDRVVSEYDFVLHICHIDLDWYDEGNIVTVIKKDNISSISI